MMRFLAHTMPGLGGLLRDELDGAVESDGRNDVVVFDATGQPPIPRSAEDVFVQIAEGSGPRGLITPDGLERALSVYANVVRGLRRSERFRVIARVLSERDTTRTAFRDGLIREVQRIRPRWNVADPGDIEIWAAQTGRRTWRSAIRLTGRRTERTFEREGALRPSVAAAMVRLAGTPGVLLDPCCGSGTILMEARTAGWTAFGSDLDPFVAKRNGQSVVRADALRLPFADGAYDAVVSNLPFGVEFTKPDDPQAMFDELLRVAPTAVVLTPDARSGIDVKLLGRAVKLAVLIR